jgi:hypothetical protein
VAVLVRQDVAHARRQPEPSGQVRQQGQLLLACFDVHLGWGHALIDRSAAARIGAVSKKNARTGRVQNVDAIRAQSVSEASSPRTSWSARGSKITPTSRSRGSATVANGGPEHRQHTNRVSATQLVKLSIRHPSELVERPFRLVHRDQHATSRRSSFLAASRTLSGLRSGGQPLSAARSA